MGEVNPEKLEAEADELFKQSTEPPLDEKPDSELEKKPDSELEKKPASENDVETEPTIEAEKEKTKKDKETKPDKPGEEKSKEPSPETTPDSEDLTSELSLENARERIQNAQARMHLATQEAAGLRRSNKSLESKVNDLVEKVDRLQHLEEGKDPAKTSTPVTDSAEYAELVALQEEYPDIIKPVLAALRSKDEQLRKLQDSTTKVTETVQANAEETAREIHYNQIKEAHSDAFEIIETDDFRGWLARQPDSVARITENGTSQDVIWLMDQYKKTDPERFNPPVDTGNADEDRLAAARNASNPSTPKTRRQPTTGQPKFTQQQIKAMSPEEFARREAEIDDAMSKGLVV